MTICKAEGLVIVDDGGVNGDYNNGTTGTLVLTTIPGDTITLTGWYETEPGFDYLNVTDGSVVIYGSASGSGQVNVSCTTGIMEIMFVSDGGVTASGFELLATTTDEPATCVNDIGYVTVSDITTNSVRVNWTGTSTTVKASYSVMNGYGSVATHTLNGGSGVINNLQPRTTYTLQVYGPNDEGKKCCTSEIIFTTPSLSSHGCLDPTDLTAYYVRTFVGSTSNPYQSEVLVDNGYSSPSSRHTIYTSDIPSSYLYDTRTGGQLSVIPPGGTSSVRLGNWLTGSQAESIMYALEVDTLVSDLLVLKYAAVLEDPNHTSAEQPRFRLEILNEQMEVMDLSCSFADFIANSQLGWNTISGGFNESVLWKDWTTVGIDLTPYNEQTIYIRLTTYDCSQSGHYGYAYFTLECNRKAISSESCGVVTTNTFSVPSGFSYLWYTDTVNFTPLGTSQSLTVEGGEDEMYYCRLSFVDKPMCNFTMSAYAGERWPLALFDTSSTPLRCSYDIDFTNRSTISADHITPIGTGEACETALWDFGDGTTATTYHASHSYTTPGDYEVTLAVGIASDACTDTVRKTVHITIPTSPAHIEGPTTRCIGAASDTLRLVGCTSTEWPNGYKVVSPTSDATYSCTATDVYGCTVELSHHIEVLPVYSSGEQDTVCVTELPYLFETLTLSPHPGTSSFTDTLHTALGCDSLRILRLTVFDTNSGDTTAMACDSFEWHGRSFYSSTDTATIHSTNYHGCDSTTTLHLQVMPQPEISLTTDTLCRLASFALHIDTDAPYLKWLSNPDSALTGSHDGEADLIVAPNTMTTYTAIVDPLPSFSLCPQSVEITLPKITPTIPQIKCIPEILRIDLVDYKVIDITRGVVRDRHWYVNGALQNTADKVISGSADPMADSIVFKLVVLGEQCPDSTELAVPIYNVGLTAPNVFTPSLSTNSRFIIGLAGIKSATMNIYDRNGRLVFRSDNLAEGWDGADLQGELCPQGDYVWHVEYYGNDYPTRKEVRVGTVLLLR